VTGRVVMVCPYDLAVPGGVQNQAVALAVEVAHRGHRVVLVSPGEVVEDELAQEGVMQVGTGTVRSVASNGSSAPITLSYRTVARRFRELGLSPKDVVHIHEPIAPVISWPLLRENPCGVVATFHRSGVDTAYRLAGMVLRRRLGNIDVARSVSEAARTTALRATGIESTVLFNGVDLASLARATPSPSLGPTVLFIGRDEVRKGRSVLLEAAKALPETVTLWITGDEPDGYRASGARVEFLGRISDAEKAQRLRAADVLCAPSLGGESFGIVLVEGLAASCTVVASDIDGYTQALGGHGILVEPGNASALSVGITTALSEGASRHADGLAYASRWSIAALADAYLEAYELARSKFSARSNA